MIFNSIRWRLQAWHGLILVAVLAGFGLTAYQVARDNQLRRIDQDLDQRLMALLRPQPPERRPERLPDQPLKDRLSRRSGSRAMSRAATAASVPRTSSSPSAKPSSVEEPSKLTRPIPSIMSYGRRTTRSWRAHPVRRTKSLLRSALASLYRGRPRPATRLKKGRPEAPVPPYGPRRAPGARCASCFASCRGASVSWLAARWLPTWPLCGGWPSGSGRPGPPCWCSAWPAVGG